MNITVIDDIINVWANDADKLALFIFLFFLPLNIILLISFFKDIFIKKEKSKIIQVIYIIIFAICFTSIIGIGQMILEDFIDAFIRAIGIILFISGFIVRNILSNLTKAEADFRRNRSEIFFYNMVRFPEYTSLIMIAAGMSLSSLSIAGLLLTLIAFIPLIILKIKKDEKIFMSDDNSYVDYMHDLPMIIPSFKKIFLKQKK